MSSALTGTAAEVFNRMCAPSFLDDTVNKTNVLQDGLGLFWTVFFTINIEISHFIRTSCKNKIKY